MTMLIAPTAGETLLSYGLGVHPDPLQAGQRATLVLAVSNAGGDPVNCSSIVLTLPSGTDATDLIVAGSAIATRPAEGWSAEAVGGVITFTPPGGEAVIMGAGLAFTAAVTINPQPGTATIMLEETTSDQDESSQARSASFTLDKFPPDFSLGDLSAVPADTLDIEYGQPAHLNWAATGADVSCTLDYQPADDGAPVSQSVPNLAPGGSFPTRALTRSQGVVFTLRAQVGVLGRDNPLVAQRQLAVTVRGLSLELTAEPPVVGINGLVRLSWNAPNADHCELQDGTRLADQGSFYALLAESRTFTVTAYGSGGRQIQRQVEVTVDPAIVATEAGYSQTGSAGDGGANATWHPPSPHLHGMGFGHWEPPTAGNSGGDAELSVKLPPLATGGRPSRVIPIHVTGGRGGDGGDGKGQFGSAPGGAGGNARLTATWDTESSQPAQFIVNLTGGSGGGGGSNGPSGSASATIDGQVLALP